jgi:hypothetical protein
MTPNVTGTEEGASLRLKVLRADRAFLDGNVEIRLHHMELTDDRVSQEAASGDILITGLHGAPQGLYRISVILEDGRTISRFVSLGAKGPTDLEMVVPRREE